MLCGRSERLVVADVAARFRMGVKNETDCNGLRNETFGCGGAFRWHIFVRWWAPSSLPVDFAREFGARGAHKQGRRTKRIDHDRRQL